MSLLFSADSTDRFLIVTWSDEAVVYDSRSNETHLLEPLAVEVLSLLRSSPMAQNELMSRINELTIPDAETSLEDLTDTALLGLRRIGLVQMVQLESR
jgi:PqqD family protein of HPr-rel-A system